MNITKTETNSLNATNKMDIAKEDYEDRVKKILTDYKKTANIPGFRKGHVPMGLIQKQYGKAVLLDEVNKLIQESLNSYITQEKLRSEEHTSELQSRPHLVCRLLLEKKKKKYIIKIVYSYQ